MEAGLKQFWRDIRTGPRWMQIAVGASAAALVLLCVGGGILVASNTPRGVGLGTATPTAQPTATPTWPHLVDGAELGGTQAAFTARYGAPTSSSPTVQYSYTDPTGVTVAVCLCAFGPGTDHEPRVAILSLTPALAAGTPWSDAYAAQLVAPFLPPDARHVGDITDPNLGRLHRYRSADLAGTFPAADFPGPLAGRLMPPGTLGVACDDPAQPGVCTLVLGD
jgi:hypothetical protein